MCFLPLTRCCPGLWQSRSCHYSFHLGGFGAGSQQNARDRLGGGSSEMARMLLAFHMHILGLIFSEVLSACISCGPAASLSSFKIAPLFKASIP